MTEIACPSCGSVVPAATGRSMLACSRCGTSIAVDRASVVLHRALSRTLTVEAARARLKAWMAGDHTVKGLDRSAVIVEGRPVWFPLWHVRVREGGAERVHLEPAAPLAVLDLTRLTLPAGALVAWDAAWDAEATPAEVSLETVLGWIADTHRPEEVLERMLVHVPLVQFRYTYGGRAWQALVDAASGDVYATVFPRKTDLPYLAVSAAGCAAYFIVAWIPVASLLVGAVLSPDWGVWLGGLGGLALWFVVAVAVGLPVTAAAAAVAARV